MILGAGGRAAARAWHGEGDARWREGYKQEGDAGRRGRVAGEVGGTWREARIRRAHASSLELGEPARPPLDEPDVHLLDFSSRLAASVLVVPSIRVSIHPIWLEEEGRGDE